MALLEGVDRHPSTHFIIIDHHPLKHPDRPRGNLTLIEVDSPYRCCVGRPSDGLMVVADLCDPGGKALSNNVSSDLHLRAIGVRRAAADIDGIAGYQLLQLLRDRRWDFFDALGRESSEYHLIARGRRRRNAPNSPILDGAKVGLPVYRPRSL